MRFDETAASALQEYRKQVATAEAEASGLYLSWLGKLPGVAVRLAVIFEHLYWCGDNEHEAPPDSISERAAVAAIAFLDRYAAPMARRCFGEAALPQVDIDARVLARWIKGIPRSDHQLSRSSSRRSALNQSDMTRYDAAIAELEYGGLAPTPAADHAAGRVSGESARTGTSIRSSGEVLNERLAATSAYAGWGGDPCDVSAKRCNRPKLNFGT